MESLEFARPTRPDEVLDNRRSFYEVKYMPSYFLSFLFLSSSGISCRIIVDNGLRDVYIIGLL
jgi:hypothetical protein